MQAMFDFVRLYTAILALNTRIIHIRNYQVRMRIQHEYDTSCFDTVTMVINAFSYPTDPMVLAVRLSLVGPRLHAFQLQFP